MKMMGGPDGSRIFPKEGIGLKKKIDIFLGREYSYWLVGPLKQKTGFRMEMNRSKFTEAEISWLMNALSSADCSRCVWREKEEDRFHCFPNGESPCKAFADKIFSELEKSGLI